MTQQNELFTALAAPFEPDEVKQRKGPKNIMLSYITARTAMNRLDDVLGPENWWDEYTPLEHSVLCRLTIRLPDGMTLTKCDAGGYAGMDDEGDDEKSGYSDAFKRAGVKFGVGRYLYRDGVPDFNKSRSNGQRTEPAPKPTIPSRAPEQLAPYDPCNLPETGGQFYYWLKGLEDHYQVKIQQKVRELCESEGASTSYKDWDRLTLNDMTKRVIRYCRRLTNYKQELEPAIKAQLEGSRAACMAQATILFAETYPGTNYNPAQIAELIAGISEDKLTNLQECMDLELIQATTQLIKETQKTNRARRAGT